MPKLKSITVEWIETACCSVTFTERDLKDFELEFGRSPTQADLKMIARGCPTGNLFRGDRRDYHFEKEYEDEVKVKVVDLTKRR